MFLRPTTPQGCVPDANPGKKYLNATAYTTCLATATAAPSAPSGVYASTWRSTSFTYTYGNWTDYPSTTTTTLSVGMAGIIGIVVGAIVAIGVVTL
jgi:hypothetical protein